MKRATQTALAACLMTTAIASLAGLGVNTSGAAAEVSAINGGELQDARAGVYSVDRVHSSVLFRIRHGGIAYFYGRMNDFEGTVAIDPEAIENTKIEFTVRTSSVDTNNDSRDGHIQNADFFNARQYPEAKFVSTGVRKTSEGVYELRGQFTLHGKTLPVTATLTEIRFGQQQGKPAVGFHADFEIKRSDFGITKYVDPKDPEFGPLGDTVRIIVSVEAVND